MLPFYQGQDVSLLRILTDRGTEYYGSEDHDFQLYLAIEGIDHTKTKVRSPQTNGIYERFHRTIQNEFYAIAFRKKVYNLIEQLQIDLDLWLIEYNQNRPHSGKFCYGQTPLKTFLDTKYLADEKNLNKLHRNHFFLSSEKAPQGIEKTNNLTNLI